ncbi:exodeoxyribonuclease VII large subunit [Tepidibacillus fermentans]|uniref:Exodeoxyribonuclease 7 large subunit n=1 Tax=Tepidibacillus fermentans TaxID=1281767 RepID=A0A4V2UT38_9BACI|nr:exodeoxyribonuclease VII large subunit [Tepidibacillus fermentans]TCS84039.1 exodeoxyribonuclease VII large subunit [Tepidibacillus fermentans]
MNQDRNSIFSISELTNYIKNLLDKDPVLSEIWVRGEISNFTHHSSGHMYFTLKDENSKIRSVMFARNNRLLRFIPKNGTKVLCRGYVSIFERDGQYQFYIQEMQPDGIGQLYLAYEQLKQKLEKEGLFDPQKKKPLPPYPKTIGIVTSATGAAIRDMMTTIKRRYPLVNLLLIPVLVQGEEAAKSIAEAIDTFNRYGEVDLLIIGRGGGSIEELWAFNEEIVARSIDQSQIPIISAVGHETDFTIADFVADVRAATPTAAAELAVPHIDELKVHVAHLTKRLERQLLKELQHAKNSFYRILHTSVFRRPKQKWIEYSQRLDRTEEKLTYALQKNVSTQKEKYTSLHHRLLQEKPNQKINYAKETVMRLKKQLIREMEINQKRFKEQLALKIGKLDALSPLKVLQRGYGVAYNEQRTSLIRSVKNVNLGDIIHLDLYDGSLDCQVWGMEESKNGS